MTRFSALYRSTAVLLVLSALTACVQRDAGQSALAPTSPLADKGGIGNSGSGRADPRTASQKPMATAESGSSAMARCVNRIPASYSATFGPGGGVLEFGDSRLIIPGGALRDTVTISATIIDETSSRVELQPHGLQFAKPAGLQLGTTDCLLSNPFAPTVVYLSPTGEVLETIQAVFDPHWHTIATPIDHFSGYAIAF